MGSKPDPFKPEVVAEVLQRLADGESLRAICRDSHMPSRPTVDNWVVSDREGFASHYARARDRGLDVMADKALEIAATPVEGKREKISAITGRETTIGDAIDRSRLHVDTLKWYLSKLAPKRYGERLAVEHSGTVSIAERLRAGRKRAGQE